MELVSLASLKKNESGVIHRIDESKMPQSSGLIAGDVESRLLEMGFIEGALVKVLYLGGFGSDPVAVRINNSNTIIALRRNEAAAVLLLKVD